MNNVKEKYIWGYGLSLIITSVFNLVLMVVKILNHDFSVWMKLLTGQRLVSHGLFVILTFFILGYFLSNVKSIKTISIDKIRKAILITIPACLLLLLIFWFAKLFI